MDNLHTALCEWLEKHEQFCDCDLTDYEYFNIIVRWLKWKCEDDQIIKKVFDDEYRYAPRPVIYNISTRNYEFTD